MLSKFLLAIIILVHVFVLTKLIYFPYPELFIYPYLTNHGYKPYQQILDQHFPGLMFLPINFDNLGMNTPEQARIWSIAIVLLIHLMLFVISCEIFKGKWKALIVNFLYLIWQPFFEGWVLWIDSFLPLLLLPAFYALYKRRIFLTGLLLGLAVVFKQVLIPLCVLVALYLFWQNRNLKTISLFLMGLLGPIGLVLFYLKWIGVLGDFWYWTVIFNLTIYAQYGKKFAPTLAHLTRGGFVFGISILALIFRKNFLSSNNRLSHLLIIFLIGSLAGTLARFDFVHFQPALPFAILGVVYSVYSIGRFWKFRVSWILGAGYMLITAWWLSIFYQGHIGEKIYFFDNQTYELANLVKQYTKPGEKIFVFGSVPHLYQMTNTLPAGDIFVFQFPWFLMVAEDGLLEGIKSDRPKIIVSNRETVIEGEQIKNYARKIDQYIQENYEKIDQVDNTDILRRKVD